MISLRFHSETIVSYDIAFSAVLCENVYGNA